VNGNVKKKSRSPYDITLGEKTIATGKFESEGSIDISGILDGELIDKKNVIIRESATVKGKITACNVYIYGKAEVDITATKSVVVATGATLTGTVECRYITIDKDAEFKGKCFIT